MKFRDEITTAMNSTIDSGRTVSIMNIRLSQDRLISDIFNTRRKLTTLFTFFPVFIFMIELVS